MGYYIQVPDNKYKASQLVELYGAEIVDNPQWREDVGLVCVVDNGPWEAAAYAYDEKEYQYFMSGMEGDTRPKIWVQINKAKAEELSGFRR